MAPWFFSIHGSFATREFQMELVVLGRQSPRICECPALHVGGGFRPPAAAIGTTTAPVPPGRERPGLIVALHYVERQASMW